VGRARFSRQPHKSPSKAVPAAASLRARSYTSAEWCFTSNLARPCGEHKWTIFRCLVEHIPARSSTPSTGSMCAGIGAEVLDTFHGAHVAGKHPRTAQRIGSGPPLCAKKDLINPARCLPEEFGRTAAKGPSDLSAIKFSRGNNGRCHGARADPTDAGRKPETTKRGRRKLLGISLKNTS